MDIRNRQHMTVTMAELQKRYQAAPYGWREIDIAALVATLVRGQRLQLVCDGVALKLGERRMLDCLRKRADTERTVVQQKIAVSDALLKAARRLGAELFGTMDLEADEEKLCGQLLTLLSDAKRKNNAVIGMYTGERAYPGRRVAERGAQVFGDILTRKGDNTAFLEAFTKAEDDLLDWSEDFQEVSFFFANQKKIFDAAWQLCERVQRERTYFADEPDALEAVRGMQDILRSEKPYRRIAELSTLQQSVDRAYERINEARRSRVQEVIVQARGDIHTLAGDAPALREEIRRADDELERRRAEAMRAMDEDVLRAILSNAPYKKDGSLNRNCGICVARLNLYSFGLIERSLMVWGSATGPSSIKLTISEHGIKGTEFVSTTDLFNFPIGNKKREAKVTTEKKAAKTFSYDKMDEMFTLEYLSEIIQTDKNGERSLRREKNRKFSCTVDGIEFTIKYNLATTLHRDMEYYEEYIESMEPNATDNRYRDPAEVMRHVNVHEGHIDEGGGSFVHAFPEHFPYQVPPLSTQQVKLRYLWFMRACALATTDAVLERIVEHACGAIVRQGNLGYSGKALCTVGLWECNEKGAWYGTGFVGR